MSWWIGRAATLLKTLLQSYGKSFLPGVAYPGVRDNRSTVNSHILLANSFPVMSVQKLSKLVEFCQSY